MQQHHLFLLFHYTFTIAYIRYDVLLTENKPDVLEARTELKSQCLGGNLANLRPSLKFMIKSGIVWTFSCQANEIQKIWMILSFKKDYFHKATCGKLLNFLEKT